MVLKKLLPVRKSPVFAGAMFLLSCLLIGPVSHCILLLLQTREKNVCFVMFLQGTE